MSSRALQTHRAKSRYPISESKFGCPTVPDRSVTRDALLQALSEPDWRVALVTGGPATGKTMTVAQWYEALDEVSGEWVTLEDSDTSADRFWLLVIVALERAVPGALPRSIDLINRSRQNRFQMLECLIDELASVEVPVVLVLDDLHEIHDRDIESDLGWLVEHLPKNVRIVMTTRVDLRMPVARWRAHSWFLEIRQDDLAMSLSEAIELLGKHSRRTLSETDIECLWRSTEGWVGGLHLAASSVGRSLDVTDAVEHFSGSHRMVADLLITEVLDRQSAELQEFMLCTSVPEALDRELCDVLTAKSDNYTTLKELEANLPFFNAVDSQGTVYRYHPLLREVLRNELAARHPDTIPALHRAVAVLFEARGEFFGAVRHLLEAGDVDRAFSIAFSKAYERYDHSDKSAALAWISVVSEELVGESVSRMLTVASALGLAGRILEAYAWIDRASVKLAEDPAPREQDVALLDALLILGYTVVAGPNDDFLPGRQAMEALDRGFDLGFPGARARPNLARARLLLDQPDEAEGVLAGGRAGDEIAQLILAPAVQARIALRRGELTDAEQHATRALTSARSLEMETHIGAFDAYLALIGAQIDRNELVEAMATLRHVEGRVQQFHPEALVYRVLFGMEHIRLAYASGGAEDALLVVNGMRDLMAGREHLALRRSIDAVEARWRVEAGNLERASKLIEGLPPGDPRTILLAARLDIGTGHSDAAKARLEGMTLGCPRDQLSRELLVARACMNTDMSTTQHHVCCAVKLAVHECLAGPLLEEGSTLTRIARVEAEAIGPPLGDRLAMALGAVAPIRSKPPSEALSAQELAVLRFLPTRLTNEEIGRECFMSVNTVKTHLKSVYSKFGTTSRAATVDYARAVGLL